MLSQYVAEADQGKRPLLSAMRTKQVAFVPSTKAIGATVFVFRKPPARCCRLRERHGVTI
ncbi:MAG: hypothetical protein PHQ75_06740 [Thermoguttaceae bacterium]|nr:hypothetical protein [Thermoguttaceae bacterium]